MYLVAPRSHSKDPNDNLRFNVRLSLYAGCFPWFGTLTFERVLSSEPDVPSDETLFHRVGALENWCACDEHELRRWTFQETRRENEEPHACQHAKSQDTTMK